MAQNKIAVVDLGGQYAHLIARRIRELGVYSEILPSNAQKKDYLPFKGIILSGSPYSICDLKALEWNNDLFKMNKPILGICYGHQMIARENKGKIQRSPSTEFGYAKMKVLKAKGIFKKLPKETTVWMSHNDEVTGVPKGFEIIGSTKDCKISAMADFKKNWYGFQFHPEVTHSKHGKQMIKNFIFTVCKCKKNWSIKNFAKKKIKELKKQAGKKNVLLLISGGVDSTVAFALLSKALPKKQLHAFHMDTGLMRKNESKLVEKSLKKIKANIKVIKCEKEFLTALKGITDPEKKRKIIGKKFLEVKDAELEKLGLNSKNWVLAQGTIYPDTIESAGTKHSDKIKTHHNRVEEILNLMKKGGLIEPLAELYKDEVRAVGYELGLPKSLIERHPFPGPGLGVRILCSNGQKNKNTKLEKQVNLLLIKHGYSGKILPIKSVGVQGDLRTYKNAVVISGLINFKKLEKISTEITNKFKQINRVVVLVSPNKIKKISLLKTDINKERIKIAQEADAITMKTIAKHRLMKKIWQFPTVLIPIQVNGKGESIVLRPIESLEAMTAKFYQLQKPVLKKISKKIMQINKINAVFFDITHKPPATIEWE